MKHYLYRVQSKKVRSKIKAIFGGTAMERFLKARGKDVTMEQLAARWFSTLHVIGFIRRQPSWTDRQHHESEPQSDVFFGSRNNLAIREDLKLLFGA